MATTKPNPRRAPRTHVHEADPEKERQLAEFGMAALTAAPLVVRDRGETTSVGFNFKMTPTDHARLKRIAAHEGRSLQKILNKIVWPAIAEMEKEL